MKTKSLFLLLGLTVMIPVLSVLFGCATVDPNSSPIVVNAERLETTASAAFDGVVNLDNSNRPFWETNAPAFHAFCEYLRSPITNGAVVLPRALMAVKLVDDAKVAYKASTTQSNLLLTAMSDLQTLVNQAQAWQQIAQTPPH